MHAASAKRIHGHGHAKCGVDAARKPKHHAGEAVLLHIVAQTRDAGEVVGGVALLDLGERLRQAAPALSVLAPFGYGERLFPRRHLHGEAAVGVEHKGGAVEHKLVLTSDLIDIGKRQAGLGDARPRDRIALTLLVHPIGRAIRHDEKPCACLGQRPAGLLAPDVLTHRHAERNPPHLDRFRQWTWGKNPLLVEHPVIGQIVFEPDRLDAAPVQIGHGVVHERAFRPGKANEHGRAAVARIVGEGLAGLARRLLERGLQHQILDWVAGEIELGEGDEVGALCRGLRPRNPRLLQIAVDVAHDGVQLGKREPEAVTLGADLDFVRHQRNLAADADLSSGVASMRSTYSPAAMEISGSGRPSRSRFNRSETMKASSSDWSALSRGSQ